MAQGREEMAHLIQEEVHPVEFEDQVPVQPEEESRQEVIPAHRPAHHRFNNMKINSPMGTTRPFKKVTTNVQAPVQNYKSCSLLDMQQMLEDWFNKSTSTIATWHGHAQRYWLDQVLDTARLAARVRHDQWLQSAPDQRASLEPAYILGDHKLIPEAVSAIESVLGEELLDVIPKTLADACMRHGYCTAELIIPYTVKQHLAARHHNAEGVFDPAQDTTVNIGSRL